MTSQVKDGAVEVHVTNFEDASATRTEEVEPEHFVAVTFSLAAPVANNPLGNIANILEQDPLRKEAEIIVSDNPVVLCHSFRQTQDPANQVATVPFPNGAYLPVGTSITIRGTGPMWVVATTVASSTRVAVIINRRGDA
jgi:hypothetical protein